MKHYGIAQWVDFSRGFVRPEMQEHLAGGCAACQAGMQFCDKLALAFRRMADSAVPDEAVRQAKAIFPVRPLERPRRLIRIPAELIYDSFLVPSPAGLRSSWQVGWQGLFHAGDCALDLRIEPELRSSKASLVGQISNRVQPGMGMSDIPVYVKAGKLVVAEARSNRFGEFQMDYPQQGRLQLCIDLDGGTKSIQVPLKKLGSERSSGGARPDLPPGRRPREDEPL